MTPDKIPCRMCQAAPGAPCKYKGKTIQRQLGGHATRTPKKHRVFHYRRVADARYMEAA